MSARLRRLGIPAIDPARGASLLQTMPDAQQRKKLRPKSAWAGPVLYEHHTVTLGFLVRSVHVAALMIGLPTLVLSELDWWALGPLVGVPLFALVLKQFGWSDVVLTSRRLVLEGHVIDLTGATAVVIVRPLLEFLPLSFAVEVQYESGEIRYSRLRHASTELRAALRKLGLDTQPLTGARRSFVSQFESTASGRAAARAPDRGTSPRSNIQTEPATGPTTPAGG